MNFEKLQFKEEFSRDIYWGRIQVDANGRKNKTTIFVGASTEFLEDKLGMDSGKIDNKRFDEWLEKAVYPKWEALGDDLFKHVVHFDVNTVDKNAEQDLLDFLIGKSLL